jgi:hypothetical protein
VNVLSIAVVSAIYEESSLAVFRFSFFFFSSFLRQLLLLLSRGGSVQCIGAIRFSALPAEFNGCSATALLSALLDAATNFILSICWEGSTSC